MIAAEHIGDTVRALWAAGEWPLPAHGSVAAVLTAAGPGSALSRARLASDLADALACGGALGPEAPGWPSFRRAARQTI